MTLECSSPYISSEISGLPWWLSGKAYTRKAGETRDVPSLGWEHPPEEGVATPSGILAWESHGQRSLVGDSPWGRKESIGHD